MGQQQGGGRHYHARFLRPKAPRSAHIARLLLSSMLKLANASDILVRIRLFKEADDFLHSTRQRV
jgi:hypothetical protein